MNTVSIDLSKCNNNGQLLWEWLGSFWHRVYQNPAFAKNVQYGQGLLSTQLYLDFIEGLSKINRNSVPVFHRERWHPVKLLRSQVNTGDAALLRIGVDPVPVLGPQVVSSYMYGKTFQIGGTTAFSASVSYPLEGVQTVMACICSSIMNPGTVLLAGTDFIISESTVFFLKEKDPFNDASFPKRKVLNADGEADEELILWCMDTLEERDYVYEQLGYVFNVRLGSSEFYRNMLNRIWDLYNYGTPIQLLKSAIGAILDEPTILNTEETVATILYNDDSIQVVTDASVYKLSASATLRAEVVVGATLSAGDFMTETIRLYSNVDPLHLNASSEYGVRFVTDVPSMFFGVNMFKSNLRFGIGASWSVSDITSVGLDVNGNPKLKIDLLGDASDINLFWQDFWAYLELNDMSAVTCFEDYIDSDVGPVYGKVAPLEYFLRYFLRANTCIIVVESDKLTDTGRGNINQLSMLRDVLPAHVMLMVTVQLAVTDVVYDLTTADDSDLDDAVAVLATDSARPGGLSSLTLTYRDRCPILRWIPTCR